RAGGGTLSCAADRCSEPTPTLRASAAAATTTPACLFMMQLRWGISRALVTRVSPGQPPVPTTATAASVVRVGLIPPPRRGRTCPARGRCETTLPVFNLRAPDPEAGRLAFHAGGGCPASGRLLRSPLPAGRGGASDVAGGSVGDQARGGQTDGTDRGEPTIFQSRKTGDRGGGARPGPGGEPGAGRASRRWPFGGQMAANWFRNSGPASTMVRNCARGIWES